MISDQTRRRAKLLLSFCLCCLTLSSALAGTITYTYDDAGRLIRVDYGGGKTITYTYDAAGNLLDRQVTGGVAQSVRLSIAVGREGTVTSSLEDLSCRDICVEEYAGGTEVTLTARPARGWQFGGWQGACAGQANPCSLTMDADRSVTALFAPRPR